MTRLQGCVCIFDVDGTLVDSAPDLTATLNRQLVSAGLSPMAPDKVRSLVGNGARALLQAGYESQGRAFPDGDDADRLVSQFIEDYVEHIADLSVLFPGAIEALDQLEEAGATLTICTNKTERLAFALLEALDVRGRFSQIIASDTLEERKPSGLPLRHLMKTTKAKAGVMIGDTFTDASAARAAGIPALIASFGYGAHDPRLSQVAFFDDYPSLPERIVETLA
ncbi:MAG: HAD-IA family hydrolase [Pseudomonadota bacterium]